MPIAPTIAYFGRQPTTIVLQSSDQFNGTAQTGTPTITPGVYTFAPQSGGGLYNFHCAPNPAGPVTVKQIAYKGGGTLTVKTVVAGIEVVIGTITSEGALFTDISLSVNEALKFSTSGATNPVVAVTAHEATFCFEGS
jgi:hypothetical protein